MNRQKAQNILVNLPYLQAFADGKDIEVLALDGSWIDEPLPAFWQDHHSFRIKPEPPPVEYVPLGPEDVPPGSVFRYIQAKNFPAIWYSMEYLSADGPVLRVENGESFPEWKTLMTSGWEIKRPGEDWQPCRKVKPTA